MSAILLKICDSIDACIAAVCRFVLYVTTVLLFGILAINVFLRYLSSTSLKAGGEAPELIFPWMVMAGVVLAAQYGSHISIVWFLEKIAIKYRRLVIMGNSFILIAAYSSLAWGAFTLMMTLIFIRWPIVRTRLHNSSGIFIIIMILPTSSS
jgi:TRAP-type C4-dicarboxylate transport system permease small subunit